MGLIQFVNLNDGVVLSRSKMMFYVLFNAPGESMASQ
jgi:hypothetical protein